MAYPPVVIVDANDRPVGEAPLAEAREKGLVYRLVFIIAERADGRYLLQKRSSHMHLFPGCWDTAAGGHVDDGNSYEEAAILEAAEELGLSDVKLTELAYFYSDKPVWGGLPAKRFVKIYKMRLDETPTQFAEHEVSEVRWFTGQEIDRLVAEHPERVAEGLLWAHTKRCL